LINTIGTGSVAPVANNYTVSTVVDTAIDFRVLDNDNDHFAYTVKDNLSSFSNVAASGVITYNPNTGFPGA